MTVRQNFSHFGWIMGLFSNRQTAISFAFTLKKIIGTGWNKWSFRISNYEFVSVFTSVWEITLSIRTSIGDSNGHKFVWICVRCGVPQVLLVYIYRLCVYLMSVAVVELAEVTLLIRNCDCFSWLWMVWSPMNWVFVFRFRQSNPLSWQSCHSVSMAVWCQS